VRTWRRGHHFRTNNLCGSRCADQNCGLEIAKCLAPSTPDICHRLLRVGAWRFARKEHASCANRIGTGDRREFLGRNGTLSNPAALKRACLSGRVGAGLDPCGAVQAVFDLPAGEEQEIGFRLGAGRDLAEAQNLIRRFQGSRAARGALEAVQEYWKLTLSAVHVETPDPSVNLMTNGWLLYQILSCRLWGRTGFYQSGGAFGF